MKRSSAQDSDNEVFYEECDLAKVGSPSQSCYRSDRKRRRGVIEKRRRDRINNSLTELRRLVPAAFEKENSAKLEKAEILQMTVDHLKSLHAKGVSGYNLDTAVLAMDYRTVGFRECTAEVARYLISVEGLDVQDPMKLRLMNHLQCYCAQRDAAAARSPIQSSAWSHHHHHQLTTSNQTTSNQSIQYGGANNNNNADVVQQRPTHIDQLAAAAAANTYADTGRGSHAPLGDGIPNHGVGMPSEMRLQPSVVASSSPPPPPHMTGGVSSTSTVNMAATVSGQFLGVSPVAAMLSPNGFHYVPSSHHNVKPYRPWGFELVY